MGPPEADLTRPFLALVLAVLLVPALASATTEEELPHGLAVSIALFDAEGAAVAWSPAPGAVHYEVYRGASPDDLVLVETTAATSFYDAEAPEAGDVWYVVVSRGLSSSVDDAVQQMRGKCVATRGFTGYSVTLAHCMPRERPL